MNVSSILDFEADCIDHEITLKILEFIPNSIEKVKPGLLLSLMCMFPESSGSQLLPPKFSYFVDQSEPKRGPHENEF